MSDLLRTVLTTPDQNPPDGTLTSSPYAVLDDGRAMWLVPTVFDYEAMAEYLNEVALVRRISGEHVRNAMGG